MRTSRVLFACMAFAACAAQTDFGDDHKPTVDKPSVDELIAMMGIWEPPTYRARPSDAQMAMEALVDLGPKAVPALRAALQKGAPHVQYRALKVLGRIGPEAKEALPAIRAGLDRADRQMVQHWIEARWRIDGAAESARRRLVPLLKDKFHRGCGGAARVLARMGPDAAEAMPALIAAMRRHQESEMVSIVCELAPHAPDLALPALREVLAGPGPGEAAAIALHGLGAPAEEIVPLQLRRLENYQAGQGRDPMRIAYLIALYGPAAKTYAPDLIRLLKHANPAVRNAAAWAVCRVDADVETVTNALREALQDADVAEEAARSLEMLEAAE